MRFNENFCELDQKLKLGVHRFERLECSPKLLAASVARSIRIYSNLRGRASHGQPPHHIVLLSAEPAALKRKGGLVLGPSIFSTDKREGNDMSSVAAASPAMDRLTNSADWNFTCSLQLEYASEENASMVYTALSVDKELQPDKVKRNMILSGRQLSVHFAAVEARFLRASFSAFMDILVLATRTIEQFGSN